MEKREQPQLTISALRQELVRLQHEHGDLPVVVEDADTGHRYLLKAGHLDVFSENAYGKRLVINVDFGDEFETKI